MGKMGCLNEGDLVSGWHFISRNGDINVYSNLMLGTSLLNKFDLPFPPYRSSLRSGTIPLAQFGGALDTNE